MVPNAHRAAGEDDKAAVTRVLNEYYSAVSRLDARAIPPYFHEPSVLIVPGRGVIATPTHATVRAVFTALIEALRAGGFARTELNSLHVKRLSATTMLAGGIAVRYKTDGQELDRAGVTYLLHKTDSAWKIAVVVVHDVDSALRLE